jgi:formate hydrogenlyase subunit 4
MQAFIGILTQLLHAALILAAAPLLPGLVRILKARMLGRRGPHLLQPWRDLAKLLRKRPVVAETASVVTLAAPFAAAASVLLAVLLVPSFARGMALAPMADLILIAGLLGLGRFAVALAGLDAGSAFGGMGVSRAMAFTAFAEPALILAVMSVAIVAGTTNLDAVAGAFQGGAAGMRVSLAIAFLAMLAVALAGNGRMPVEDPATQLEPAMVQEAMLLEASGRHLALWQYEAALRLTLWLALIAAIFLPMGLAPPASGPLAWALGLAAFAVKLAGLALALAALECAIARMRLFRVPQFLGAALLLGLLGAILLFVSTGPA